MRPVGLVLAAGASRRPGYPKALAKLGGRTLARVAVDTLREAGCRRVVVVIGGEHAARVRRVARRARAEVVVNVDPSRGMFSSLQAGLGAVGDPPFVVVALVDHPHLSPRTVVALIDAVAAGAGAAIPLHRGRPGHPLVMGRELRRRMVSAGADDTAQRVVERFRRVRRVPVADAGVLEDLDTASKLARAGARRPWLNTPVTGRALYDSRGRAAPRPVSSGC